MFISTAQHYVNSKPNHVIFNPIKVKTFDQFCDIICDSSIKAYSMGTFKNNYRNKNNFQSMKCIGLDIDNDKKDKKELRLDDAKAIFKDYKHIIATTRSHQKEKNGKITDRFRVILFLEKEITDNKIFEFTWNTLQNKFPFIDEQCKDSARYWFPSKEIVQVQKTGSYVSVPDFVESLKPINNTHQPEKLIDEESGEYGKLAYKTMKFFCQGADAGSRNGALFQAAIDCREQGYPIEYVMKMTENMIKSTGNWGTDYLNEKDKEAINNAYTRDVKYDKREDEKVATFNFRHIKETINDNSIKTDWLVEGLLTSGGFSIFAGQPKSGKSTLTRQLAIAVARGTPFLGRKVNKGKVFYLALEEQLSIVKEQLMAQRASDEDSIYIHEGPCTNDMEVLKNLLITEEVSLLIIDTMALFLREENLNDYGVINNMLSRLRSVARDSGCHIMVIHHQNKSTEGGALSIMGSNAIHGAVDCAITLEVFNKWRFISSSQRGGTRFFDTKLAYNTVMQTYKLANKQKIEEEDDGF